jgi:hypothetical protein|tara:strand:+ start:635 stop:1117 length:483 start_codon:yes stop_codon:yes gene_type:complete
MRNEPTFDAPIPGMSLTHELGARPWQTPAQFPSVDEAIQYYMESMSSDEFIDQLMDVIEMGVPLADIANTMQLSGVMEGLHSVDVGALISPVLIEMMSFLAESAGVEYVVQAKQDKEDKISDAKMAKIIQKLELTTKEKEEENVEEVNEEAITGLMSRRQ